MRNNNRMNQFKYIICFMIQNIFETILNTSPITMMIAVVTGAVVLIGLKKYCAGGQCRIQKDLSNQIAVVTGGNTGIGKQTVKRLSELGCKVIVGARSAEKNKQLTEQLSKMKGKVTTYPLDLSDRQSIQNFVQEVKKQLGSKPLSYLINNAGVMALPTKKTTKQGIQMQIGVNHFGHFYLTYLLWQSLKSYGHPRIINVSSKAHSHNFDIDFNDISYDKTPYQFFGAYTRSKRANILFTKQLQKRMQQAKINGLSASLHPGVVRTELTRDLLNAGWKRVLFQLTMPIQYILMKSSAEGAQTTLYTLLEREDKLKGGQYYVDCAVSSIKPKQCLSDEAAKKLWEASQKAWGIKFNL